MQLNKGEKVGYHTNILNSLSWNKPTIVDLLYCIDWNLHQKMNPPLITKFKIWNLTSELCDPF